MLFHYQNRITGNIYGIVKLVGKLVDESEALLGKKIVVTVRELDLNSFRINSSSQFNFQLFMFMLSK